MKAENRWIYIGGVGLLVALVVIGLVMSDRGSSEPPDVSSSDGGVAADGAVEGDGASADGSRAEDLREAGAAVDVGAVPADETACRAYCQDLSDRGALASGTTVSDCVDQLCASEGVEEDAAASASAPVETITEPELPAMPDDCQEQCRLLQQRGELREGTTLEQCFAALCGSEEDEEE